MAKNKRPQRAKVGNRELAVAMQELRRSSAASPHANKKWYTRKEKYKGAWKRGDV
jgi:hypothetical protein